MEHLTCPKCGSQADAATPACPGCGHALLNGVSSLPTNPAEKPPVPPGLAGVVFQKLTPEQMERARQTFNMEEFQAGVREIEETGGLQFEDFVEELQRAAGLPE